MGKATQGQLEKKAQEREARKLLDGIVEQEDRAEFGIITPHSGRMLCLDLSYDEAATLIMSKDKDEFVSLASYYWTGSTQSTMSRYHFTTRVSQIVEVFEVTEHDWIEHCTSQVERAQMAALQRMQAGGGGMMPHGG